MITITQSSQLSSLPDGNRFIGTLSMQNSQIVFSGKNNILYCDGNVALNGSYLHFAGDNSVIYLCMTHTPYKLSVELYNDCVFYIGKNNFLNGYVRNVFKLSEQKHIFIGNDCLISFDISFRTADPHLVYDADSGKRLNYSKSIYIGDHVWIGQSAMLLKGTQIHSGSIIGSMALLANKKVPHQSSWGGNPAKMLRDRIVWKSDCVHAWRQKETQQFSTLSENDFTHLIHDPDTYISFDVLDADLTRAENAEARCEILKKVTANNSPVRFVEPPSPSEKKPSLIARLFGKKKK